MSFFIEIICDAIFTESPTEITEVELSHAAIITGCCTTFFRFRKNGESNKKAIRKKDKKRKLIKIRVCVFVNSLFALLLKYNKITTPMAATKIATSKINQYFVPNEIKSSNFYEAVNIHISFF